MFRVKRILFPIDFSARSYGAAAYAEMFAGRFDAEVILLHVIEPMTYNSTLADADEVKPEEFDKFLGPDWRYLHTTRLMKRGEPARKIVECAVQNSVDLIMMPTQGMGIYRRLILGSTVAKVLHDADCPVWTGTHLENVPVLEEISFRHIVCAVDLNQVTRKVFDWACRFSSEYGAELTLVHVIRNEADRKCSEEKLRELLDSANSQVAVRIEIGDPHVAVTHAAEDLQADLLIIGRKASTGIHGRLETTAYSIIRRSPCPVISV